MKPINFINTLAPAEHRSVARILQCTVILICVSILIMGAITLYQLRYLTTLKQDCALLTTQCARFTPLVHQHEQLTAQEQELRTTLNKATAMHKKQRSPHELIQTLSTIKPTNSTLQTLSIHQHEISCALQCPHAQSAHSYLQALTKTNLFTTARITAIKNQGRAYHVNIQLRYK